MLAELDSLRMRLDPAAMMVELGYEPDPWQAEILRSTDPRMMMITARQIGKSLTTACLALHVALFEPGSLVLLFSPSLRQSSELFRKVAAGWSDLGRPVAAEVESATTLGLANGSRVVSLPGSAATVRGFSGPRLVVVDEAALTDDDLFVAINPMLAASPRGRLISLSTPFGHRGWMHREWTEGGSDWRRVRVTAAECPRIAPEFLAAQRRMLGERWYRQEYECSFEQTIDQFFDAGSVASAFAGPSDLPAIGGDLL